MTLRKFSLSLGCRWIENTRSAPVDQYECLCSDVKPIPEPSGSMSVRPGFEFWSSPALPNQQSEPCMSHLISCLDAWYKQNMLPMYQESIRLKVSEWLDSLIGRRERKWNASFRKPSHYSRPHSYRFQWKSPVFTWGRSDCPRYVFKLWFLRGLSWLG